ncbi:exopolyphosphatase [Prevotella sp. AGR2160]|uniref:Ppx/GppA phosphatase family protein n=1 Tax=Prevotella sp. AGR2160 TaxID=1280674 RepID=UPI00049035AC|nr:exopolyphosphatase [Prevotella sp. AGR2160]
MEKCNLAAVDVGSNAARLLIKHVEIDIDGNKTVSKLLFLRIPLRLGMDVFAQGKISEERAHEFICTMKAYRQLMKAYQVSQYRACATSAMRDAKNGKKIIKKIAKDAHLRLEIISGDEESQIIYDNHLAMMPDEGCFLYVDVGGGSTEISFICDGERVYSHSFNVGTIRLLNGKVKKKDLLDMKSEIERVTLGHHDITIIGSGGNINKLYRLASKKEKLDFLPVETLRGLYEDLHKMSVEERMKVYSLKPDRADVIVPAAEIFLHVAASSKSEKISVPNLGLADGIINEMVSSL